MMNILTPRGTGLKKLRIFFILTWTAFLGAIHPCESVYAKAKLIENIYKVMETTTAGVSPVCVKHIGVYLEQVRQGEPWALEMLDSIGKRSDGLLEGNVVLLGFYSQCLNAFKEYPLNVSSTFMFSSRYCLTTLSLANAQKDPPKNFPRYTWSRIRYGNHDPRFGLCVPSTCTPEDVTRLVEQFTANFLVGAEATRTTCSEPRTPFFSNAPAVLVAGVLGLFVLMAIIGTAYDVLNNPIEAMADRVRYVKLEKAYSSDDALHKNESVHESFMARFLLSFSLPVNFAKLMNTDTSREEHIQVLHGIRFYSMIWVISGHATSFSLNMLTLRKWETIPLVPPNIFSQAIANGTLVVDTFLFMSGLLVVFITLKLMNDMGGRMYWSVFFIHRYWRMTPVMMAAVGFCATILPYMGDGPRWMEVIARYYDTCKINWWLNALYIQNLVDVPRMCLDHSWYLAVDVQCYMISPIFLWFLYRKPKLGVTLIVITLFASVITTGALTYANDFPAAPYASDAIPKSTRGAYMMYVYIVPHTRLGPFLVGMLMGYYIHVNRGAVVVNKYYMYLGSTLSAAITLGVLYGLWPTHAYGILPSRMGAAVYGGLGRTLWAVGMAWIVFASLAGYGGVATKLLCWKPLVPLSRLTYSAYIIHPVMYAIFYGSREETLDFSYYLLAYFSIGHIMFTFMAAVVVTLLFESPFMAIEKLFLPRKPMRKEMP